MLDEESRRAKAAKIAAVIMHFLGRTELDGLAIVDVGCSGGIIAAELDQLGADVIGLDIDVEGIEKAKARYGHRVQFFCADSEKMPLDDDSADVVICNHVYEHVVDPEALFAEMSRVCKPNGIMYLGLGNRLGVMEPHYRLPFLSWLPRPLAHRYVRVFNKADFYHEAFRTRRGLLALVGEAVGWDYTFSIVRHPSVFGSGDAVPSLASRIPVALLSLLRSIIPTYIWVVAKEEMSPQGESLSTPPRQL